MEPKINNQMVWPRRSGRIRSGATAMIKEMQSYEYKPQPRKPMIIYDGWGSWPIEYGCEWNENIEIDENGHFRPRKGIKMTQFKVGDVVISNEDGLDITIGNEYTITNCARKTISFLDNVGTPRTRNERDYILKEKTMDNLKTGDVLVKENRYNEKEEYTVGGVLGKIVFLIDSDDETSDYLTVSELKPNGYELKTEEEAEELTVAEIEAKLGHKVKVVK